MAGKLTNYLENELIDHVLKVGAWSRPANLYVALCTADPGETATGATLTEPAGNGYARVAIDADWAAAAARATSNSGIVTFAIATGAWGTITHFAIVDSASGAGNVLCYGEVTPNKSVTAGMNISIAVGDLDVSWQVGAMSDYLADKLLDHCLKGTSYTAPTHLNVAFATVTIVDADTGSTIHEPAAGGYARIPYDTWKISVAGVSFNTSVITFAEASGAWGTITHFALCDTLATGQVLFYGTLTTARVVGNGDTVSFPAGALSITLD